MFWNIIKKVRKTTLRIMPNSLKIVLESSYLKYFCMRSSSSKKLRAKRTKTIALTEFNELIHSTYSIQIGFKILNVNKNIKEEGTSIDQTDNNNVGYNYLFFDNVHLNHPFGVPLL